MTDRRTATLRLTVSELAMLLRAVQERIAHADGDERDVLRSIAAGLTDSILELRRPPEPEPEPEPEPYVPRRPEPERYVPQTSPAPGRRRPWAQADRPMSWIGVPQRAIRRWAAEQGIYVSPSGQISADVIALYRRAHPDEP